MELSKRIKSIVTRGEGAEESRKYYRFRGGRWYGGIATADCVGCNLRCVFCWGWYVRDHASRIGRFYTAEEVFRRILRIARKRKYRQVRVSGGEPTISRSHLLRLLELTDAEGLIFILETNGILIGADKSYARALSQFERLHVRVSLKGASPREFSRLTGADPRAFELQLKALENLLDEGVSVHPAVMLSFSNKEDVKMLVERLREIDPLLVEELEEEYVFLYPHVVQKLKEEGVWPRIAYDPRRIPKELI